MFLHMTESTILSALLAGCLSMIDSWGGSVARAREAKVSMIRLTQSICTAFNGVSSKIIDPEKTMNIATTLTVSWN